MLRKMPDVWCFVRVDPHACLTQSIAHEPLGVVAGEGLPHMPAGLDEHRLEGVHGDPVVGAVSAGVHVVVAAPVLVIAPVNTL